MEEKAADLILDKGVKFSIKTTGLRRLFGKKKTFEIKALFPGTMVEMSRLLPRLEVTKAPSFDEGILGQSLELIGNNAEIVCKLVAIATLRKNYTKFQLWLRWRFFYWNTTNEDLEAMLTIIILNTKVKNFLNSIVYLKGQNILSPKQETSPTGTGEIIAPGD